MSTFRSFTANTILSSKNISGSQWNWCRRFNSRCHGQCCSRCCSWCWHSCRWRRWLV